MAKEQSCFQKKQSSIAAKGTLVYHDHSYHQRQQEELKITGPFSASHSQ